MFIPTLFDLRFPYKPWLLHLLLYTQGAQLGETDICAWTCFCCLVAKLQQTLCDHMYCSLPGTSVHGFPRQEYWSGLLFPAPGDLPDPGIKPGSPGSKEILYHWVTWKTWTWSCLDMILLLFWHLSSRILPAHLSCLLTFPRFDFPSSISAPKAGDILSLLQIQIACCSIYFNHVTVKVSKSS